MSNSKVYPVQITSIEKHVGLEVGEIVFMTSEFYHEDFGHICSQGYEEVFDVIPLQEIPEDY